MMIMPANNSGAGIIELARKHRGKIGWLNGPSSFKRPVNYIPYALDNDAFSAWRDYKPWDESAWFRMLDKAQNCGHMPMWVLCPDKVGDCEETLRLWDKYWPEIKARGWRGAFAVQDGMEKQPRCVPVWASVVFVGGSTFWKWRWLRLWTEQYPRVHVGRVNEFWRLHICEDAGVESVDGTGWMRGTLNGRQGRQLQAWLEGGRLYHDELM